MIHTVGPIWNGGNNNEDLLLSNCYTNSLRLAIDNSCKTVAFPNISTGVYHFPKNKAAQIAVDTIQHFKQQELLNKVIFVCFDDENYELYKKLLIK
ncbi:O-acetyl-ADP-ribose deacetylase [compost metagenome]